MNDQHNGPGYHLSLAQDDGPRPRKRTARQQAEADKQSADLAAWVETHWVPCAKCREKHPPQHGSHCIVCAVHTPEAEQRSFFTVGPRKP